MEFKQLIQRAMEIRRQYEKQEIQQYGSAWANEEIALGFVGDVGDLVKLVVAENGKRNIPDSKKKLEHELADCLWSVIVLADKHNVDLEFAFMQTMDQLEAHLTNSAG